MSKLSWEKFEPLFGSYSSKIKPFFDRGGFDSIYNTLKSESSKGKEICPVSSKTYTALQATPYKDLTAVIVGLSPYNSKRNGEQIADGLI